MNAGDAQQVTAIQWAAREGHADVVKVLIENGADVHDMHAFVTASAQGHLDVVNLLIQNGVDVNAAGLEGPEGERFLALPAAAASGRFDVVKVLLQNGADVNANCGGRENITALFAASSGECNRCTLLLLCFGAEINDFSIKNDKTNLLQPIEDELKLLRNRKRIGTSLLSNEERRFMWNLAFFFTIQHRGAAFKAYHTIRSFITFHGIFMGPGYDLGEGSVWKREEKQAPLWD
jgi:ankyrin repeat protein